VAQTEPKKMALFEPKSLALTLRNGWHYLNRVSHSRPNGVAVTPGLSTIVSPLLFKGPSTKYSVRLKSVVQTKTNESCFTSKLSIKK
jgi:hypothetical protein